MTMAITNPAPSYVDDRYVVVSDPRPGTIVELAPGSQLAVRFRRPLGLSRWQVVDLPGHLLPLPLSQDGHEFQFLVFGCPDGVSPARFERRHPDHDVAHEVCELLVVSVSERAGEQLSDDSGRTSRSASPRTA